MYTASLAFFEALWAAGVTHCFVNLGSDHPSIIEAMVTGQRGKKDAFPRIITCPNEMVAMSMADGYARVTGKPQCVIVHVDVGTQALGAAVHNASCGRAPVLVFAGVSPFTQAGEMRGSRTEFIHWIQDVPDQKQIVSQYCRYTAEIKTGFNIKQMVGRALQMARSDPKVPRTSHRARGLPTGAARAIAEALAGAKAPLVRHVFPADHAAWLGVRYGVHDAIREADAILVLDCDVPWIPTQCAPPAGARVFHVDVDPLKQQMPVFWIPAQARYRADARASLEQILDELDREDGGALAARVASEENITAARSRAAAHAELLASLELKFQPREDGSFGAGYLCRTLRRVCPEDAIWAVEAVTNTGFVHDGVLPTRPGSWINCGGGGLGWSGGGAMGIKLAADKESGGRPVCGWNAPRNSYLLVHPDGEASRATNEEINISFDPVPDYSGIAKAAAGGQLHAARVDKAEDLERVLAEAVKAVQGVCLRWWTSRSSRGVRT
ncbi:unnamed protein product [Parascedosporium putredinis]|uniref:Thiamine pyrophosphate enzyme N-terminal TPP-binding domain-containing protein n=1 Tax=Parascedosporium putredinis TaxID=1442378 RepID=A0A9P1H7S6_9PEZI|nr:unnamed protein product [Parascedosporium putredinis]CAI8000120.1 unnamed protein product [Parascedosporium putredinis]